MTTEPEQEPTKCDWCGWKIPDCLLTDTEDGRKICTDCIEHLEWWPGGPDLAGQ